ncbi:MAG TPA: protoporphyrinogen oxidase [Motilibacteraceae bacterium]|nr:protoporphyrinogen oxidase [Motilibacteraceae bacterium]
MQDSDAFAGNGTAETTGTGGPVRRPRVVVVGGGIAGLAAAHAVRASAGAGVEVLVLEGASEVGGKLRVHEVGGLALDAGAESLLARRPEAVALARAVGLGDEIVHPATTSAGVWSRGGLHPLPAGQVMGVPTDLRSLARTGLLSAGELARVPVDEFLPRTVIDGDVSVGSYVARRMGHGVVDRIVEPLLGGVYAGHADRLSLAAAVPALFAAAKDERSLLAAARRVRAAAPPSTAPVFAGIRGGVGRLPQAVAASLGARVRTGAVVRGLERTADGWRLVVGDTRTAELVEADAVVLAVPAHPAARLLADVAPRAAAELGRIDYASVALVTYVFPASAVGPLPEGSGFLVPPVEGRTIKAATFAGAKWGWVAQAAGDAVVVRVSVGRQGEERDLQLDDAALADKALADLSELVPVHGVPLDARVTRWGGALPQYAVGHPRRVSEVRAGLADLPTVAVAGAALDGLGVPACIASGQAAAGRVLAGLEAEGRLPVGALREG